MDWMEDFFSGFGWCSCLHETDRSSPGNRQLSLSHLGAVFGLLQLLLSLPELGQVEGSNLLSLLDLLLVGLDLLLQLLGKFRHLVLVLLIFLLLELQLLNPPLRLLVSLGALRGPALNSSQLNLHLSDAALQLGHGCTATLHSHVIGLSQTVLQFIDLRLKSPLGLLLVGSMVLFSAEFISQPSSINHSPLGLLLVGSMVLFSAEF